jgi:predicted TIM-barrel fold metal-dependent hydrolase
MNHPWIDTHIHVSNLNPDGQLRERMLDDLLDVLDRCDADLRLVVSCDGSYNSVVMADETGMMAANSMVNDLVQRAPGRLYGACIVNPHFPQASLDMMKVAFGEWGFVMLGEMLQYMMKYRMDSDEVEQIVRLAVHYDVPVQVHIGTYWTKQHEGSVDGMDHLRDLLRCADRVPEAKYILAHAIGCGPTPEYVPWANMILDTLGALYQKYPDNFWIEIRDFQCPALPRTIAEVPTNRLLAGTDWTTRIGPPFQPYGTMFDVPAGQNPFPPEVASFVGFLEQAGASEQDIARIGFENPTQLLGL